MIYFYNYDNPPDTLQLPADTMPYPAATTSLPKPLAFH